MFILFVAPIIMTAWYGGRGPAILASVLGLVSAELIFIERVHLIVPKDPRDVVAIGVYAMVGALVVSLSIRLRRARDDARAYAAQLEDQAMELELQTTELEQQTQEAQALSEELELANEELKTVSSTQLAEAQSLARLGSWEWNIGSDEISWSDEMYRLYGVEPGSTKIDYAAYQSLLHPDDRDSSGTAVRQALETGEPFAFDHRVIRANDGEERIFSARGKVIRDGSGKPARMIGTGQDVTEQRRASAALRSAAEYAARQATIEAAARHLNRVFSKAPVLIAVLAGPEHRFELMNEKATEMISRGNLLGQTVAEAMPEMAEQGFIALLDSVYMNNEPFVGNEIPARLGYDDGDKGGYFNFVFQPLSDETGVYAVLVVATDVTDLVSARIAAESAKHDALQASRAKSDFLARMSHELRTPLAAIIGYGELLADGITGPVNEEQKKQLNRIRSSANHLLSIIDEILTLARMEAGKEAVNLESADVGELLDSVSHMAEPLANAKGLQFKLDKRTDGASLVTDPMKLRQVLLNLISNAVKYTERGAITVTTEMSDGTMDFLVRDTGVGISQENIEKIFEPFWQVEQTTTRRSGGTGLGLAVTRQFVELLGGNINVTSTLGDGSTFRVSLPRAADRTVKRET